MLVNLKNFHTEKKKISSWNLTHVQKACIIYPENLNELKNIIKIFNKSNKTFSIRTGECSYDSKSMSSGSDRLIISLKKFNKIININKKKKLISVEAGAKLSDIIYFLKKNNLTLYSVPGGEHITIGGAIAANVIGKDSNKLYASFGDSIEYIKIISYDGKIKKINKSVKNFYKYIGSFGMFGIILEAKIKLKKIVSNNLMVESKVLENIKEVENELKKKDEYKYIQIDPFFRKKNFAIAFKGNYIKNLKNNYKKKNFTANLAEISLFKISSFFLNLILWRIFYKLFFLTNKNKKSCMDLHNFHYKSKYKHMVPLISKGGLLDYEILIERNFNHFFLKIKNFLLENNLAPIYIIIKKIYKSKKKFFYNFNKNGYSMAISFNVNSLNKIKKDKLELMLKESKLSLNLSKTDSQFIKKNKEIYSKKNKIFMSLYKNNLINKKYAISR